MILHNTGNMSPQDNEQEGLSWIFRYGAISSNGMGKNISIFKLCI